MQRVRKDGFALDDEEFLPGLLCIAVLVPSESGPSNLCVAVQAPVMRLGMDKARQLLPALQRAAQALGSASTPTSPTSARAGRESDTPMADDRMTELQPDPTACSACAKSSASTAT